ncbi:TVP38/TMEM64 family membrane protein OS=Tsukamurella paurometabola (strain ATCC 8368 / DSM /CCUG 35730 / CIP 100753 / JCM 10117 / KCTC 9821 / NBRC 16120/ NCIMB 702349 / NCTC 13040) OX=521096 GN=Tpau_2103 PE=3 SV=1 [Tsukamurella paurometabola]|uniref:TVP38/TMEM64 family membrane protein n=1 Tax=Tsukamurella paurometabola (strain ATCC 8368 / DSM 20162 / CCUG 35730 / CIP 100753 / JCM 10117 / KCTC 9821 / NBRC 16120 / NCIMB 702349 / NCTC 13040) TaxID=521096 RepID=D5UPF9_TSUPD|nr:TVP38/TMEM64 family protein [Tsukamurella paurometabola]ADG78715.1 SNARE associated Golgi protein-related protein [Tsukamurella paurometabola DSM 20162]SUP32857.1 SNARE associated Golgi protein [Tsukamurella paurometabola]
MGANETRFRPGDRSLVIRAAAGGLVIIAVVAAGLLMPHPAPSTIRAWADSTGPWFLALFFVAHVVVTVFPVPRTMFTVSAGFLFGPVVGITVCMLASTLAAIIAFLGVREIDRRHPSEVIARLREHRAYAPVAARLRTRGWLAVGSLRLIAPAPFSLVNYASALSPVRFWPYTVATVAGLAPGTIAVVLLGDALTGRSDPWLVAISVGLMSVGLLGLVADARMPASPKP